MKYINKLGQYEYPDRGVFYTIDIQTIIWDKSEELKYVYTGQLLPETDIFDGICMIVYNNGSTTFSILFNFIKRIYYSNYIILKIIINNLQKINWCHQDRSKFVGYTKVNKADLLWLILVI